MRSAPAAGQRDRHGRSGPPGSSRRNSAAAGPDSALGARRERTEPHPRTRAGGWAAGALRVPPSFGRGPQPVCLGFAARRGRAPDHWRVLPSVPPGSIVGTHTLKEEANGWIRGTAKGPVLRGHLQGPRPSNRQGTAQVAPGRHRSSRGERLAATLAKKETRRVDAVRTLTFGSYLTSQWLPAKKLHLATSTYRGYERNEPSRPSRPREDRAATAALPADRVALQLAALPHRGTKAVTQDRVRDPPPHPRRTR